MRIAIVGCGAVGSYYGACLARAGHDVHCLLRSDFDAVQRHGLRVLSPSGEFVVHPRAARTPQEIGIVDWVVIGLKTTANAEFSRLLPPLVGSQTAVLTLQNGLGNEEALARLFPTEQILGGLCFVCLNRTEPGVVSHIAHGRIVMGEFRRPPLPRTWALAQAWEQAGVPCTVSDDLARAHWEKLVWNIPFNGLGVASCAGIEAVRTGILSPARARTECLTTDRLLADPAWLPVVRELMAEVINAAQALGHPIPPSYADWQVERTLEMGAYRASTLIDFERGQDLELESLFGEPLRQAQQAGVAVPRLEALTRVLSGLALRR